MRLMSMDTVRRYKASLLSFFQGMKAEFSMSVLDLTAPHPSSRSIRQVVKVVSFGSQNKE